MFIEVTDFDQKTILVNANNILWINQSSLIDYPKIKTRINFEDNNIYVEETYKEIKAMLQAIENAESFNNTPWSSLSEETREAFLDELKQAREGLESRLGDK